MHGRPASHENTSILFVCMGNICRSPMADAVMRHLVAEAGLTGSITVDSAGTHDYHLGHGPHPQTCGELARRGIDVGRQRSRLVTAADLAACDHVVALDRENVANLESLAAGDGRGVGRTHARLSLLLDHAPETGRDEVPDPYYVGGYDVVFDLVDAGCRGLLELVIAERAGRTP